MSDFFSPSTFPQSTLLLVFAATSLSSSRAAPKPDDYLPLNEGDEWTMNAIITSPNGTKSTAIARRKVEGKVERDGKNYIRARTWIETGQAPVEYAKLTRKNETGFYSIDESAKNPKEQVEVILPFKIGQTWKKVFGQWNTTDTVVGLETVTVNGKTYENCYHLRSETADGAYKEDFWEAPGVGSVKSEIVYGDGSKIVLTLKEFKSGKAK